VNWGRGLFRLWLILSAFWIAGCAAIVIVDGHLLEANKTYEVEGRLKEKYEVVAPPSATLAEVVAFAQQNQRADCSESKTGPWCSYPVKLQMPGKAIDPVAIYLALGVPAGALLIGGALYWALSGFRRAT
jgi:hypothetical protein